MRDATGMAPPVPVNHPKYHVYDISIVISTKVCLIHMLGYMIFLEYHLGSQIYGLFEISFASWTFPLVIQV